MKKSFEHKAWLEKLEFFARRYAATVGAYDLEQGQQLEDDAAMARSLLALVKAQETLEVWLQYEIDRTRETEAHHAKHRAYGHAQQQADFRAALMRVQSKIDLMERQNEG